MNEEQKFWITIWLVVLTATAAISIACVLAYYSHTQKMSELGFQKETIQGYSYLVWQKIED